MDADLPESNPVRDWHHKYCPVHYFFHQKEITKTIGGFSC